LIVVVAFASARDILPSQALVLQGVQRQAAAMKRCKFLALGMLLLADEAFG
jgi:hypothetical protein